MAIRFDIKKYEKVKQAYISQLWGMVCSSNMRQCFSTYKPYLDSDKDVLAALNQIRAQKQQSEQKLQKQLEQERIDREQKRLEQQRLINKAIEQKKIEERRRRELERIANKLKKIEEGKRKELEYITINQRKLEEKRLKVLQAEERRKRNTLQERHYYMGVPPEERTTPQRRRIFVTRNISTSTKQLADINSYEDLSFFMNSSHFETIKKSADLDYLTRMITTYAKDNKEDKNKWLKKVAKKEKALALKEAPKTTISTGHKTNTPKIIYTAMGGMTNYKKRR